MQPLSWPRRFVQDGNGRFVASDTIPAAIQQACAELALALLRADLTSDKTLADQIIKSKRVGDLSITYAPRVRDTLPTIVRSLIALHALESRHSAVLVP